MKPTMMDPEGAYLIATLMLDALGDEAVDYVGGLEMGAVPIVSAISPVSHRFDRPLPAFFVRKKAKGHGARMLIEGIAPGQSLNGKRVAMVEDVTTTGGSVLAAIETVREAGGKVVRVLTIVDRQEGAEAALAAQGLKLTPLFTADEFKN
ncbi:MAG: orotate phosphoribosyltransferase [Sphingomonadales bacterium]